MSSGAGLGCGPSHSCLTASPQGCALEGGVSPRVPARQRYSSRTLRWYRRAIVSHPQEHVVRCGPWVRPAGVQRAQPFSLRFGLAVKQARPRLPGLASAQQTHVVRCGLGVRPIAQLFNRKPAGLRAGRRRLAANPRSPAVPVPDPALVPTCHRLTSAEHVVRCGFGCGPSHSCLTASPRAARWRRRLAASPRSPAVLVPNPALVPTCHRLTPAERVVRCGAWVRPAGVQRAALSLRFGLAVKQARPRFQASRQRSGACRQVRGLGAARRAAEPSRCASGLRLNRLVRASRPRVAQQSMSSGAGLGAARRCPAQPSLASGLRLNRLVRASRPRVSAAEHVVRCGFGCGPSHSCLTASPQGCALEGGV